MAANRIPQNPFVTGINIPDGLFCGRWKETAEIINLLRNGNNIVLKSKRRIGKSSLIKHILSLPEIRKDYNTFYLDIYGTKDADEFRMLFQTALLKEPWATKTKVKELFNTLLKGLNLSGASIDPVTGSFSLPGLSFTPNQIPRIPLVDLFAAMEGADKPCICIFDEFQQIEQYPENITATIRSFVQQMNNTKFIFSGSSRHMLATMFNDYGMPFYKSAVSVDLEALPLDEYREFCQGLFKVLDGEAVDFAYYLFSGETQLMQQTMNFLFSSTAPGARADVSDCQRSVMELLRSKDVDYKEAINRIDGQKERNTLVYVAYEGVTEKPMSLASIRRFDLSGAAQVQNALHNLGEGQYDYIERIDRGLYTMKDRLFELWLSERMGILPLKFSSCRERYEKQKRLENQAHVVTISEDREKKRTTVQEAKKKGGRRR